MRLLRTEGLENEYAAAIDEWSGTDDEQVRAVDVARIGRLAGTVPGALMRELDDALRLHLDL